MPFPWMRAIQSGVLPRICMTGATWDILNDGRGNKGRSIRVEGLERVKREVGEGVGGVGRCQRLC